jgi:hypothetical protein
MPRFDGRFPKASISISTSAISMNIVSPRAGTDEWKTRRKNALAIAAAAAWAGFFQ